jgi:hypothetical protein
MSGEQTNTMATVTITAIASWLLFIEIILETSQILCQPVSDDISVHVGFRTLDSEFYIQSTSQPPKGGLMPKIKATYTGGWLRCYG